MDLPTLAAFFQSVGLTVGLLVVAVIAQHRWILRLTSRADSREGEFRAELAKERDLFLAKLDSISSSYRGAMSEVLVAVENQSDRATEQVVARIIDALADRK